MKTLRELERVRLEYEFMCVQERAYAIEYNGNYPERTKESLIRVPGLFCLMSVIIDKLQCVLCTLSFLP